MNREILTVTFALIIVATPRWLPINAVNARSSETRPQSAGLARCFQDIELSESLAALKLQGGERVAKAHEFLLSKARTAPGCRKEVVEALIARLAQATNGTTNQSEDFSLWQSGASLLAELKATEALDLLIANIDLSNRWSASISQYNTPALVAILKIGASAIPKLQVALTSNSSANKRQFAAFCIAYIGGTDARKALITALPSETDPCVKKFLQLSLQAFRNRASPNHISSALRGKWLSAFYCL